MLEIVVLSEPLLGKTDRAEVVGELRSPLLDRLMHADGKVSLYVATTADSVDDTTGFVLDSFHFQSINDYLREQARIRESLESELPKHQEEIDPDGEPVRGDVWTWARIAELKLRSRNLRTPGTVRQLERAGHSPEAIDAILPVTEKPDTRSSFTVVLDCDWSPDHQVEAIFRDGKFVGLD